MSQFSRRGLLKTGAAAGVIAATGLPAKSAAKRGGKLRMGLMVRTHQTVSTAGRIRINS